jgi:hypothetical protein
VHSQEGPGPAVRANTSLSQVKCVAVCPQTMGASQTRHLGFLYCFSSHLRSREMMSLQGQSS